MEKKKVELKRLNKIIIISGVIILLFFILILSNFLGIKNKIYNTFYKARVSELTTDNIEIEKKWLIDVNNIKYDLTKAKVYEIEQTYINFSPEIRVRRVNGTQYSFTLKKNMSEDGMVRDEFDFLITESEYNELVSKKVGDTILKTRYKLLRDNQIITIDIFKGNLEGLAYLEIEFANIDEANAFGTPDWVIKDVTDDIRYKNASLAQYGIPENLETNN